MHRQRGQIISLVSLYTFVAACEQGGASLPVKSDTSTSISAKSFYLTPTAKLFGIGEYGKVHLLRSTDPFVATTFESKSWIVSYVTDSSSGDGRRNEQKYLIGTAGRIIVVKDNGESLVRQNEFTIFPEKDLTFSYIGKIESAYIAVANTGRIRWFDRSGKIVRQKFGVQESILKVFRTQPSQSEIFILCKRNGSNGLFLAALDLETGQYSRTLDLEAGSKVSQVSPI